MDMCHTCAMDSAYWVQWSGSVRESDGNKVDPANLRQFLITLASEFHRHVDLSESAITTYGGVIVFSAKVSGTDDGEALNSARRAFGNSIALAGGQSDLPDGNHDSWSAKHLTPFLQTVKSEVKSLALVG